MRKLAYAVAGAAVAGLMAGPAMAASAKFTATIDKTSFTTAETQADAGGVPPVVETVAATIKVPNKADLLIGVSAQIAIDTETKVKGKKGGGGSAEATADVAVDVEVCPVGNAGCGTLAEPGEITFSKRTQELEAVLGGVIESCTDSNGDGTIDVDTECTVTDEEIRLLLETTAAHHFNFVAPNLEAGEYVITASFAADADASIDDTELDNTASASVVVGPRVVSVEQVRATNKPDGIEVIEDE